jgi:hypothetical protein
LQSLPNELIAQISEHLDPKDLVKFASTCKDYKDLFSKEVQDYKDIARELKDTYYHEVSVCKGRYVRYKYFVYNIKEAMIWCKNKVLNRKLLEKYIVNVNPIRVIVMSYTYNSDLDEYTEVNSRKMDFEVFLYYISKEYLNHIEECNKIYKRVTDGENGDLYEMERMRKE